MSKYYVDPKTGEKHEWVLATDNDFEKVEEEPIKQDTPTIIPALHLPGIAQTPTILPSGMLGVGMAPEGDFNKQGNDYRYTGTAEYVEIPHRINGEILTSYHSMFRDKGAVKAVKSTNPNVTDMDSMFSGNNNLTILDLTELDVSNVKSMSNMFSYSSNLTSIDITGWDTSKVGSFVQLFRNTTSLRTINLEWLRVGENAAINRIFVDSGLSQSVRNNFNKTYTESDIVGTYTDTKEEPILYEQEIALNNRLDAGIENVLTKGIDGKRLISRSVTEYSNGVKHYDEIGRSVVSEPTNKVKEIGTRIKDGDFVLATDEDFDRNNRYIGPHKLVEIPHAINGEPVSRMPSFTDSGVMGIKYTGSGPIDIEMSFDGIGTPILDISRIDFSKVGMMMSPFGWGGANFTLLIASEIDFSHFGEWDMYGMFGVEADVLDLRGTKFPVGVKYVFDRASITEILVLSEEEADTIRALGEGNLDNTTFTIQPFITITNEYEETESVSIPYEVIEVEDAELKIGLIEVDVKGIEGEKELVYQVVEYSDGNIERELINETIVKEPVNQEQRVGTNTVERISWDEVEEVVPYETKRVDNEYLPIGREVVEQDGKDGLANILYKYTHHYDGRMDTEKVNVDIITEPIDKVIQVGIAVVESIEERIETHKIKYSVAYEDDSNMYQWEPEEVLIEGQDGLRIETYEIITYASGEVEEFLINEEITEAIDKVIKRGIKVGSDTEVEEIPIPYETERIEAPHLVEGREQLIQSGKAGYVRNVYKLTRLDNGEIERVLDFKETVEPTKRIVYIGTMERKHWNTEIYFMNVADDRDYFVDGYKTDPIGINEKFGITLKERPIIPTAELRYDEQVIHGRAGDIATEDNYNNVEITLSFNYISDNNARETYNKVSNAMAKFGPGTRVRFSDDDDGTFRELARKPIVEELNNDLYNWGDFSITLVLRPFRYVEERERELTRNVDSRLEQPLPNAMKIPQVVEHLTERNVDITTRKNGNEIYTVADAKTPIVITDANIMHTYGGDKEW